MTDGAHPLSDEAAQIEALRRRLARRENEVEVVRRVAKEVNASLDLGKVLHAILRNMCEIFGFEHSMILLLRPEGHLELVASQGYSDAGLGARVAIGDGVIGVVAKRRRMMRMGAIGAQRSYLRSVRSRMEETGQGAASSGREATLPGLENVQSTVAVPMTIGDHLIGVFAVESAEAVSFDKDDEALISTVANQAALAIQNASLFEQVTTKNAELRELNRAGERFVPFEFLHFLNRKCLSDVQRGEGVRKMMSVFFSDIRSFTSLVERMSQEQNFAFINEYLEVMGPGIREHGGFIDKFIGDAIMALFDEAHADEAVRAALANLQALSHYNRLRTERGDPTIDIGISIHTGPLMLGTVGTTDRLNCTVSGDSVNLASRIESLTKLYGAHLLISDTTRASLRDPRAFAMRFIDRVRVRGKTEAVTLYEILDGLEDGERRRKLDGRTLFEGAREALERGDLEAAAAGFREVLGRFGPDPAAAVHAARAETFIGEGLPEGWDGVTTLVTK